MVSMKLNHPVLKIVNSSVMELPSPSSISTLWNFGSLLGLCLAIQIITGVLLALHFTADTGTSFDAVIRMSQDVPNGWHMRTIHANGASLFFVCLYSHASRGLYYGSYSLTLAWGVGVVLLLLVMATAFLGYVLPWGQMSFWGTSVITNLLSAIPVIGEEVVMWIWGGFAVGNPTLTRFFAFHFLAPFVVSALALVHLIFIHKSGSNNPLGLNPNLQKISFLPFFGTKDLCGFILVVMVLMNVVTISPWFLGDPENFIAANPMVTPVHIQPEWYFLFAYAILRSIPNKLGGVIALAASVLILITPGMLSLTKFFVSSNNVPVAKIVFWFLVVTVILLTWIGARPVEHPFVLIGQFLTVLYFSYYLISNAVLSKWEKMCK